MIETEDLAKTRKGDLGKEKRNEKEVEKNPLEAEISKVQTEYSLSLSLIDEQAAVNYHLFVHVAWVSHVVSTPSWQELILKKIIIFWAYMLVGISSRKLVLSINS